MFLKRRLGLVLGAGKLGGCVVLSELLYASQKAPLTNGGVVADHQADGIPSVLGRQSRFSAIVGHAVVRRRGSIRLGSLSASLELKRENTSGRSG